MGSRLNSTTWPELVPLIWKSCSNLAPISASSSPRAPLIFSPQMSDHRETAGHALPSVEKSHSLTQKWPTACRRVLVCVSLCVRVCVYVLWQGAMVHQKWAKNTLAGLHFERSLILCMQHTHTHIFIPYAHTRSVILCCLCLMCVTGE